MAFIAVWLRLSHLRQLDWYRNSAHQSKDIAHVQKTVAQRVADKVWNFQQFLAQFGRQDLVSPLSRPLEIIGQLFLCRIFTIFLPLYKGFENHYTIILYSLVKTFGETAISESLK